MAQSLFLGVFILKLIEESWLTSLKSQHLRQVWPPSARIEFPIGQMVHSRFTDGFGGARGESRTLDPRLMELNTSLELA